WAPVPRGVCADRADARDGRHPPADSPFLPRGVPHRPIPPSCWHSHMESASTMFSTLMVRVQTIAWHRAVPRGPAALRPRDTTARTAAGIRGVPGGSPPLDQHDPAPGGTGPP